MLHGMGSAVKARRPRAEPISFCSEECISRLCASMSACLTPSAVNRRNIYYMCHHAVRFVRTCTICITCNKSNVCYSICNINPYMYCVSRMLAFRPPAHLPACTPACLASRLIIIIILVMLILIILIVVVVVVVVVIIIIILIMYTRCIPAEPRAVAQRPFFAELAKWVERNERNK